MKRFLLVIASTLLTFGAQAKLNVVATTPDFASIAKEIGGDKIELMTLGRPTEDPHFVDAKPSFIVKLNHADVLVEGGAELEIGWLPALLDQCRNGKLAAGGMGHVICSRGIRLLEVPATLDRSRGDVHAAGNPHYMTDPVNAKVVAQTIANAFCALDDKSSDTYRANLQKFEAEIDAKLPEWQNALAPFNGQQIVAYHDSWLYFANRFGLKSELFLEPKPGIPPTPAHLAEVMARMKQDHVHVVLVDPYLDRKTAETVARSTGATVVGVTQFPGGVKGTEGGYIQMMDYLVNSIAKAFAEKK